MHYTVGDFLLDLVQNSIEADAGTVNVSIIREGGFIRLCVQDDGKGMDEATQARVLDPFYTDGVKHKRRKVGLGIPFLVQAVELSEGSWKLESAPGKGTVWKFSFPADALDTPPLGDIPGFVLSALAFDGDYEFCFKRQDIGLGIDYELNRSDLVDILGDLNNAGALVLARDFLESQEAL